MVYTRRECEGLNIESRIGEKNWSRSHIIANWNFAKKMLCRFNVFFQDKIFWDGKTVQKYCLRYVHIYQVFTYRPMDQNQCIQRKYGLCISCIPWPLIINTISIINFSYERIQSTSNLTWALRPASEWCHISTTHRSRVSFAFLPIYRRPTNLPHYSHKPHPPSWIQSSEWSSLRAYHYNRKNPYYRSLIRP